MEIAAVGILLAVLYSLPKINLKKRLVFGTLTANSLYTIIFPLIGWAATGKPIFPTGLVIYLFFFGIGIATLKDFEDIIGDNWHGSSSLLSFLGFSRTLAFIVLMILFDVLLLVVPGLMVLGPKYVILTLFAVPLILIVRSLHLNRHVKQGKKAFLYSISVMMLMEIVLIAIAATGLI